MGSVLRSLLPPRCRFPPHYLTMLRRRMSFRSLVLLLALPVLFWTAGCGPKPPPDLQAELPDAFPNHTVEDIRTRIRLSSDTLTSFRAKASLSIESPARSGRFSADLHDRRGDSLYLSISVGGLGIEVEGARALVTPDSFFLYNRIEKKLTYGAIDEAGDALPAVLTGDNVFMNLLGIVAPEEDVDWRLEADSAHYVLRDPEGLRQYRIDPALWRVVRYEERTSGGALVEERAFSNFDEFEGVYLPRRVVLRRPGEEASASLYYRTLDLNPPSLSFDLRVSGDVEREPVE